MKHSCLFAWIFMLIVGFGYSHSSYAVACRDVDESTEYSDEELEAISAACDKEIAQQRALLAETKQESQSYSRNVSELQAQINKSIAFINSKTAEIKRIKSRITTHKNEVEEIKSRAQITQESIAELIREQDKLADYSFVEAVFSRETISDFFVDITNYDTLNVQLEADYVKLADLREKIEQESEELAEEESLQRQLAAQKEAEAQDIKLKRATAKAMLANSKQQEKAVTQSIEQKKQIQQKLRARLFTVASGQKVSFGEAYDVLKPYQSALGMDAAFILAILFQESGWGGKIGGNIGQCTYKQIHSVTGRTVMSPKQHASFETIMSGLGIDVSTQKVSCPVPRDGAYGGAMGPAQFMPATWLSVRDGAAKILGKSGASMSPFINRDAFITSGYFLRGLYYSQGCKNYAEQYAHVRSQKSLREKCAAAKYYAGGNWFKFRNTYGESVSSRADRFRRDIATLNE